MIDIKEHNGKIRVGFKEIFEVKDKQEAQDLMVKFMDYKEKHTKGILAEKVAEKI